MDADKPTHEASQRAESKSKKLAPSAGDLTPRQRERIVSLMEFHESTKRVTDILRAEIPGITQNVVLEVMVLAILRAPRPAPARGFGLVPQRRTA
jgi:hypothetical protein